jgi:glycosyltransferase involved in cell wall biosynthesis
MTDEPRHVAVNTRLLLAGRLEGLGRSTHEVLSRLTPKHPDTTFSFFFDRPFDPAFVYSDNVRPYVLWPPTRHPILCKIWFDWSVKRKLDQLRPDLFFSPDGFLSATSSLPQVPVIYDLGFEHRPTDTVASHGRYYRKHFPRFARQATHIVTASEYSKADIASRYDVAPEKITVTGCAPAETFRRLDDPGEAAVRSTFTEGRPFFHYVGALQPRKNVENLLEAFATFRATTGAEVDLLIVGRKAWKFEAIEEAYETSPVKAFIHFTGFVDDDMLNRIYNTSLGLTYVPWFEGFGMPVVEAMRCGCPVITSTTSSLPEVAGDAAVLVEPSDPDAIADAMRRLWQSPARRGELAAAGRARADLYDWEEFTELTWQVLCRAAGTGR